MIVVDFENSQKIGSKRGRDEDQNDSHKKHIVSQSSNDSTIPFNLEKTQQNARKTTPEEMKMRASRLYKMGAGGSRKVVQSIDFQPDQDTEYENYSGEWINCNTIPESHPPNLCYGGGEPDTDIISFAPLYDNSLGRYKPGTLYLGNGICTSWKNYVNYFGSKLDQNRINYDRDFIPNPVTQQEFKCGNGVFTFEYLRRIIPSQYNRIQTIHSIAQSLLRELHNLQVHNIDDEKIIKSLAEFISGPDDNFIRLLEFLSIYLRNVLIDVYSLQNRQGQTQEFETHTLDGEIHGPPISQPPLGFNDPAPNLNLHGFVGWDGYGSPSQKINFIRQFIQNISARLRGLGDKLAVFLENTRSRNINIYFMDYKGVASIVYILNHLEYILLEVKNELDDFNLLYPLDVETDDDGASSITLGSDDTDDFDDE